MQLIESLPETVSLTADSVSAPFEFQGETRFTADATRLGFGDDPEQFPIGIILDYSGARLRFGFLRTLESPDGVPTGAEYLFRVRLRVFRLRVYLGA